jgi:hypothetical protein
MYFRDQGSDVHFARSQRLLSCEGKQIRRQLHPAFGSVIYQFDNLGELRIVGDAFGQHIDCADYNRKQIVEVVRDAAGKLPDLLHFLRLCKPQLGRFARRDRLLDAGLKIPGQIAQFIFRRAAFGNVDVDSQQPLGSPLGIADRMGASKDPSHSIGSENAILAFIIVPSDDQLPQAFLDPVMVVWMNHGTPSLDGEGLASLRVDTE